MQIKEGINLQLATTGGHKETSIGDHQRGSPMTEVSCLESKTDGDGSIIREGEIRQGRQMKKSYKAVEMRALNLLASNSNKKCERRGWERARDPGKEEEERESFKLRVEKGSGKADQVSSPGHYDIKKKDRLIKETFILK